MTLLRPARRAQEWPEHVRPSQRTTLDEVLSLSTIPQTPGNCYGTHVNMFPAEGSAAEGKALAVCVSCPIKLDCLRMGLDEPEQYGVWGGLPARERRLMKAMLVA